MPFIDLDIFFHAAELAELRFDADAFGMGAVDDAFGYFGVFLEGLVTRVNHD